MSRGCPRPKRPRKPVFRDFPSVWVHSARAQNVKKVAQLGGETFGADGLFPQRCPLAPGNRVFPFLTRAQIFSKCPRPKTGQTPVNHHLGVRPKKKLFPRKLRKIIPDSVLTFVFDFGTPSALRTRNGPVELACCLLACLLDAQAPPWWSNNLINRLKYYALQLGDPNPNQNSASGPS